MSTLDERADHLVEVTEGLVDELIVQRLMHNLTQREVADLMGVTTADVFEFERDGSDPTLGRVRRYALAVGATIDPIIVRGDDES